MDYSIILIFSLIILVFSYQIYYNYFKVVNKISDKQLIQNFMMLTMKQDTKRVYFPKMELDYEI